MRVIAGKYRHINLVAPLGDKVTRPTMDRVKEAIFNILNTKVVDSITLDLFAGSGALGIEALSRGAKKVIFNDQDYNALKSINANLEKIKADKNDYQILKLDYKRALNYLKENDIKVDILLLDPPYKENIYNEVIDFFKDNGLFNDYAKVIIEAKLDTNINLDAYDYKFYKYGEKKVILVNI